MFNKEWFEKHQKLLLWLLNTPIVSSWFRSKLRIKDEVENIAYRKVKLSKVEIARITPNAIFWIQNKKKRKVGFDIRTHDKFSKRLFLSFKPLWSLIHCWDTIFANNLNPKWNLGFDNFGPLYPAAGANSPVDGFTSRGGVDEDWATLRGGAGNAADVTGTQFLVQGLSASTTSNQYSQINRGHFLFDTSVIGAGATIDTAVISLWSNSKLNQLSGGASANSACVIVQSTCAATNTLANSDYGQTGSTDFGQSVAQSSITDSAYNDITLNASGEANIDVAGISKFATRSLWDLNNTTTGLTWSSEGVQGWFAATADTADTTNDPKLTGTFTAGGGATVHIGYSSLKGVGI